jgi:hypothetical protein
VFFKHKYLTMPSFTPADALITAADNLVDTINGIIPKHTVTSDAVEQLMEIYKIQAEKATCEARTQRVLREQAQAQRVKEQQLAAEQQASPLTTPTSFPNLEVDLYLDTDIGLLRGTPIISQDEDDDTSSPAANTRQKNSDTYLNSRLHATHDGDTRLHGPILPTASSVTNLLITIPL